MYQILSAPIKQILLKYRKQFLRLSTITACILLTSCFLSSESDRYYEGDLKIEINGETYEYKIHWVCETHMGLSASDLRFHPVTRQKHWPSQIYKVQSLKDGSVLIYVDWRWCESKNFSPETFEITLIDSLTNPIYGEVLVLRENEPATVLNQRTQKYKVKLIAATIRQLTSSTKISPKGDRDKELLNILRNTVYGYQAVSIKGWRTDGYFEKLLTNINGVWDADSIIFPLKSDHIKLGDLKSFSFIPLSRNQASEKRKNLDAVSVKYGGQQLIIDLNKFVKIDNGNDFKNFGFDYKIDSFQWANQPGQY